MKRRDSLASSLVDSASAGMVYGEAAGEGQGMASAGAQGREFYELRLYQFYRGPGAQATSDYLKDAAIPALNRAGIRPVGVFEMLVGPESPSLYVLIPHPSAISVLTAWERVRADSEYQERGAAFLNAPASNPPFVRVESEFMVAFETHPRITPPAQGPRVFELRTYENATKKANLTKIKMFNTGEIDIFKKVGFHPVFFGEKLIGQRWPNLTYMLASESVEDRNKHWAAFGADPDWKRLRATPGYSDDEIVSNITNVLLRPAAYSQV
ncbi:MAG: NIPSNAP family containing protein [Acidobacteria bacterium]|nr:MAG: NIPSNAP family containing protein [Acidobacteriota bacterium]